MNCNQFTPDISATSAAAGEAAAEGRRKINPKDSECICNHQHCWNTCHLICGNMTSVATCSGAMLGMQWYRDPWGVELKMAGCHVLTARHCEWRQIDESPAALFTMPGICHPMTSLYILRTTNMLAISLQFLKLFQARDKCVIFPWRIQSDSREKPSSRECLEYDTSRDSDYFRFIMSFLSFLLNCCRQPGKISWTLSNITTSVTSTGLDKVARA